MPDVTPPEETTKPVTPELMLNWNNLIAWNKQKGYAGSEKLDHDESLRKKVFAEYNAANPDMQVPYDSVKDIQQEILNYKQTVLQAMKAGTISFENGVNEKNFMSSISKVDNIFGQFTSQWAFPKNYQLVNKETGEKKELGLAPHHDIVQQIINTK